MKKNYLLLCIALCSQILAQVPNYTTPRYLDKNMVKARMNTVNNQFWAIYANNKASYEVPKGKGANAQFANSLWIGGYDHQGTLHISANTYRQNGADFWPGPLDTTNINAYTTSNTAVYNSLWKVDCNDINNFVTAWNNGQVAAGTYTTPADLLNYPAKGIGNFQKSMEPFYDANSNGAYNPVTDGDYPIIKGHQQILSIYNDNFTTHTETMGAPAMGLEVHQRLYCYQDTTLPDSMQAVNYSTFVYYTIYNRSATRYYNVYLTDWNDVDLGYYGDDFVGTDTVNGFTYCYNGDNFDETVFGNAGYGQQPPVISHAVLKTPCGNDGIDNDCDSIIDEPGEQFIMNRSSYYVNNTGTPTVAMTNPDSAIHYYRFMSGKWKNGTPVTYGGTGYGGSIPAKFVYTGDPSNNTGWTEGTAGNTPGDRRIFFSSGPFDFPAHSKLEWGYAIVFSEDVNANVNTITEFHSRVQRDVRNVLYYDQMHQNAQCAPSVATGIQQFNGPQLKALVYPNPAWNSITVQLSQSVKKADIKFVDISGRLMKEASFDGTSSASIETSDLTTGLYFVEISAGNLRTVQKLVKSR